MALQSTPAATVRSAISHKECLPLSRGCCKTQPALRHQCRTLSARFSLSSASTRKCTYTSQPESFSLTASSRIRPLTVLRAIARDSTTVNSTSSEASPSTSLETSVVIPSIPPRTVDEASSDNAPSKKALDRMRRVRSERATYLVAAIISSISFTCLAAAAVVYRFASQVQDGGDLPLLEIAGTFALAVGAAVGMEFWARWAHKALWHGSLWHMHESHHRPREGPFETNDVFAIINAGPAIGLLAYGFFFPGLVPGLCFGAGLGITMFGIAYMFVHDGLVHKRFPVGPVADVPYLQKVAAAHKLHHADKFEGVPFGLFLGPQELTAVGGTEDLEELLASRRAGKN